MKFSVKKINVILFLFLGIFALTMTSCQEVEGCMDVASENYNPDADIDDGSCVYARDEFIGTYNVNENCTVGNFTFTMTVTESSTGITSILLANLGDYGETVRAVVTDNSLEINDTQGGITFSGSGNINGSTLTIIYTASANGLTDNCTSTCIKQ